MYAIHNHYFNFVWAFFNCRCTNAWEGKIDSLQQLVQKSADDTNKVTLLISISYQSSIIDPDGGLQLPSRALALWGNS
ncbi:MAG: hypothetical protein IPN13_18785 [Bacteroidetes bacterium]|nr:hypothetical protein [Bacteroidota bacterium]